MNRLFLFLRPRGNVAPSLARSIFITNILSLVMALLTLSLLLFYSLAYQYFSWYKLLFVVAGIFISVIFINRKGFHVLGRNIFCIIPVSASIILSLYIKYNFSNLSILGYFDVRFFMIVSSILPGIVFEFSEKRHMFFNFIITLILLMSFDILHEFFGIGFYQRGFQSEYYYYINYIVLISYSTLVTGIMTLKWLTDRAEREANRLIIEKDAINRELELARQTIEVQHNDSLRRNETLEEEVAHRTESLRAYTQQLEQFAFVVSHELRAPVARVLGLGQLLALPDQSPETRDFIQHSLVASTQELDDMIRRLHSTLSPEGHLPPGTD